MAHTTTEQAEQAPEYITVAEAAAIFSLPASTGYERARKEWKPFRVKLGGNIRINRRELMKWAATQQGR
jgi:hypothetical protein